MKKFRIAFILIAVTFSTAANVFAQNIDQKDPKTISEVDSLMNPLTPQDSSAFGLVRNQKDSTLAFPADTISEFIAQDSLYMPYDSSVNVPKIKGHKKWSRPKKTMVMAMLLPGAGQVYNKKYWKLPILYAGITAIAYFWITNQRLYNEFKNQYNTEKGFLTSDSTYTFVYYSKSTQNYYTDINQLASDRDTYRRYRDMSIAGAIALYSISILDAYVDAHLRSFDLNPDLSLSVKPMFYNYNNATFVTGLSLNFKFKNNRIRHNQLVQRDF